MKALTLLAGLSLAGTALAGPYAAHGVTTGDTAFTDWATSVANLTRGPMDIANPGLGNASYGTATNALGAQDGSLVSLGDGGSITLNFANGIGNGAGADFAVFENGFVITGTSLVYAELAYVEVSSDGTDFFRMPSVSLTSTNSQIGAFDGIDPTDVHNLAGQFGGGEGTPFDLQDLAGVSPLLDVDHVTSVRIVDVVGDIDPTYARYDSLGHIINDPWSTPFASSGFDLDGVGVIHAATHPTPEPASVAALGLGVVALLRRRKR